MCYCLLHQLELKSFRRSAERIHPNRLAKGNTRIVDFDRAMNNFYERQAAKRVKDIGCSLDQSFSSIATNASIMRVLFK